MRTSTNGNNDGKSISAGMDMLALLLAVLIGTVLIQLIINVTMIANILLIMRICIRTTILVRVIVTATVQKIVVIQRAVPLFARAIGMLSKCTKP